jgi:hypothetical protein
LFTGIAVCCAASVDGDRMAAELFALLRAHHSPQTSIRPWKKQTTTPASLHGTCSQQHGGNTCSCRVVHGHANAWLRTYRHHIIVSSVSQNCRSQRNNSVGRTVLTQSSLIVIMVVALFSNFRAESIIFQSGLRLVHWLLSVLLSADHIPASVWLDSSTRRK